MQPEGAAERVGSVAALYTVLVGMLQPQRMHNAAQSIAVRDLGQHRAVRQRRQPSLCSVVAQDGILVAQRFG